MQWYQREARTVRALAMEMKMKMDEYVGGR